MSKLWDLRARLSRETVAFWILVLGWAFSVAALYVGAFKVRWLLSNIDGISYISIAENYFAGRLDEAVNAYWSPLISWTMLPFMAMGTGSQFAMALASATWAALGMAAGMLLVWRCTDHRFVPTAVVGVVLAIFGVGNLSSVTPDLILASWVMIFALVMVEANRRLGVGERRAQVWFGVLLGVTCALGYFAKAFALPLFSVVGLAWVGVRLLAARRSHPRGERRAAIVPLLWMPLAAILALVVVCAPFVGAMSMKYGGFTVGSSLAVNFQGKFTDTEDQDDAYSLILAPPPSPHSISFSDDRTAALTQDKTTGSSTDASDSSLIDKAIYYLQKRFQVPPYYLAKIEAVAPFAPVIGALFVILLGFRVIDPRRHPAATMVAAIMVTYFLGYWAITSSLARVGNYRYHWPELGLSVIVAALLWPAVWRKARAARRWWSSALAGFLMSLLVISTIAQHGVNYGYPFTTERTSASVMYLVHEPVPKPANQVFAEQLVADGVIAPWSKIVGSSGQKDRTLLYAFYMRAQLFGRRVLHDINDPRFVANMQKLGIDYYFLYEPSGTPTLDVSKWGHVKATYEMPYDCDNDDEATSTCRLSIVALDR